VLKLQFGYLSKNKSMNYHLSHTFLYFIFVFLLSTSCNRNTGESKRENQVRYSYQNPNSELPLRDTHIMWGDSAFYAVGTCAPVWGGPNPGVKLYTSRDLKSWEYVDLMIDAGKLPDDVWYKDRFWAPELHHINGRYFLTFNSQNSGGGHYAAEDMSHHHACGLAVADHIEGPYTVVTHDVPITPFPSNDMTLFQDDDKRVYVFFNNGWTNIHNIYVAELDTVNYVLKEEPVRLISQEPGTWDGGGIEGAFVVKNDGTYYMFYSSWTRGYAVGYATAGNPYGPWKKYENNPLFGAFMENDTSFIFREGEVYADPESPYVTVGHNQVFTGPDGRLWTSFHGYAVGDPDPSMLMDPIWFEKGRIVTDAPTYTPQEVDLDPDIAGRFPGLNQ
jgi:xylan 1,4-beta-xylosidase